MYSPYNNKHRGNIPCTINSRINRMNMVGMTDTIKTYINCIASKRGGSRDLLSIDITNLTFSKFN